MKTLKEMLTLKNRVSLITGAAGHIGSVIAHTLAELGADLILVDQPGTALEKISLEVAEKWAIKSQAFACNLEHQAQRLELTNWAKKNYTSLNVLVNNAAFVGTSQLEGWVTSFENQHTDTFNRGLEVNLTAIFEICRELSPLLKSSPNASIINIGSIYGQWGPDWRLYEGSSMGNSASYAASKAGALQLTRWLATTLAPSVRVNAVSPGGVFRGQETTFVKRYEARVPLQRMATEEDFKGAIAYLATDLSAYITGQNIAVDGGYGIW